MTDYFALLEIPRRPRPDEEMLKRLFHARAAHEHPDVATAEAGGDFAQLNLAYQNLSDPRLCVRHLLELERGGAGARHQAVPEAVAVLFTEMGALKQRLDDFLRRRSAATSALAKAMLAGEGYTLAEEAERWLERLEGERASWLEQLAALDARWEEGARESLYAPLGEVAQALGYLDRWCAQVREALVRLQLE